MHFPGFCGGSYTDQSVNVDAQSCVNLYPAIVESGHGKAPDRMALFGTPGLLLFSTFAGAKIRGIYRIRDRVFLVDDTTLWELSSVGGQTSRGTSLANDGLPVSFTASATELLLASGGRAYSLNLSTNTFTTIGTVVLNNVAQVGFLDSFFIALIQNSNQFYVSALLDALTWPDNALVSVFPGRVVSMIVDHRQILFLGEQASVAYASSGDADFPFAVIPGSAMEQGAVARDATVQIDNTVAWVGGDENGQGIAWRAQGFTPQRISTHAVEHAWRGYSTISDAIGYTYQDRGHSFWVLTFPTASRTWAWDAATGMWAERAYRNPTTGALEAHLSQCATFAFGKVLVGDRQSGKVYELSASAYTDDGAVIRRVRRAPHLSAENKWLFHSELTLDIEAGVGPIPPLLDGAGNPRDPQIMLRMSDDGGHTWSNERTVGFGQAGNYNTRAIWHRLGRSRDRVYEVSISDPVKVAIVGAYLEVS